MRKFEESRDGRSHPTGSASSRAVRIDQNFGASRTPATRHLIFAQELSSHNGSRSAKKVRTPSKDEPAVSSSHV